MFSHVHIHYIETTSGLLATLNFKNVSIVAMKFILSNTNLRCIPGLDKTSGDSLITPDGCPETMQEFTTKFYEFFEKTKIQEILPAGTSINFSGSMHTEDIDGMIQTLLRQNNQEITKI